VGDRGAEHGHDGVADELLDHPAERFDLGLDPGVIGPKGGSDVLGIGLVRAGGELDQVHEQDGDDLALFCGVLLGGEGRAAALAEAGLLRVLHPAGWTDDRHI
jgi:hypothetical protein